MVGVVGSSPIAPTKFGTQIKHLAATPGAFFLGGTHIKDQCSAGAQGGMDRRGRPNLDGRPASPATEPARRRPASAVGPTQAVRIGHGRPRSEAGDRARRALRRWTAPPIEIPSHGKGRPGRAAFPSDSSAEVGWRRSGPSAREGEFAISTTAGKKAISVRTLAGWAHAVVAEAIEGFQLKRIRSGVQTLLAANGVSREVRGTGSRTACRRAGTALRRA